MLYFTSPVSQSIKVRSSPTKLVCAVGSRNGTEETKLLVLDFDVTPPSTLATPDSSGATSAIEEEDDSAAFANAAMVASSGVAAAVAAAGIGDPDDIGVGLLDDPVLQFGDDAIV